MGHNYHTSEEQLRQWFSYVDTDRSGYIEADELHRAMTMGGIKVDRRLCQRIVNFVDEDGNGQVDFKEYRKLHNFLMKSQKSFWHFDKDRSGSLSFEEAYQAVRHAGYALSQRSFQNIFQMFDEDRSRTISFGEYLALSIYLQTSYETYQQAVMAGASGGQSFDQMLSTAALQAAAQRSRYTKKPQTQAYGSTTRGYGASPYGAYQANSWYPAQQGYPAQTGYPANNGYSSHGGYNPPPPESVYASGGNGPPPGYPGANGYSSGSHGNAYENGGYQNNQTVQHQQLAPYSGGAMQSYQQQVKKKKKMGMGGGLVMGLLAGGLLAMAID